MRGMHLDVVITSPFRRCMQTSAEIVAELGMAEGTWLVDWAFSEVRANTCCCWQAANLPKCSADSS